MLFKESSAISIITTLSVTTWLGRILNLRSNVASSKVSNTLKYDVSIIIIGRIKTIKHFRAFLWNFIFSI